MNPRMENFVNWLAKQPDRNLELLEHHAETYLGYCPNESLKARRAGVIQFRGCWRESRPQAVPGEIIQLPRRA